MSSIVVDRSDGTLTLNSLSLIVANGITADITGDASGSSGSCTGNAATATTAGACSGQAATVATIAGLAPNTATTQAAQPNITSVGTLTSLAVAGAITAASANLGTGELTCGSINRTTGTLSLEVAGTAYLNVAVNSVYLTGSADLTCPKDIIMTGGTDADFYINNGATEWLNIYPDASGHIYFHADVGNMYFTAAGGTIDFSNEILATTGALTCGTINGLTQTAEAVGFTIAGGTTPKTLTISETCVIDQDLQESAAATFGSLDVTGDITSTGGYLIANRFQGYGDADTYMSMSGDAFSFIAGGIAICQAKEFLSLGSFTVNPQLLGTVDFYVHGNTVSNIIRVDSSADGLGFYGHAVTAQQTGVAATAEALQTALVNLGLITAA